VSDVWTAAYPEQAAAFLTELERHGGSVATRLSSDPELRRGVIGIADASRALSATLLRDPTSLASVDLHVEPVRETLTEAAGTACQNPDDGSTAATALRRWKQDQLVRIALRDLTGIADLPTVGRELSTLADACLATSLALADPQVPVAVLAMGKLGGSELNYSSDVDIVLVHDADLVEATRVGRAVIATMAAPSAAGIVFRVDTELRPEGSTGPLSRTPESYRAYFDDWAQPWERQAWIKARFVAGDQPTANRLLDSSSDFVWAEGLDPETVRRIRQLKQRAEDAVAAKGGRELKRGPGGIRDVEFTIQLLQLVHGRHDPALRSPNTLTALEALVRGGFVDREDATHLEAAFHYLRTVEHRLQLRDERQLHELPTDEADRTWLARVMGNRDSGRGSALAAFDRRHSRYVASVREIQQRIFYRPVLEAVAGSEPLSGAMNERLAVLGFEDPGQAASIIERLTSGLSRSARTLTQLFPLILESLAGTPEPDLGLIRLSLIADGQVRANALVAALRESPASVSRVCLLLASSRVAADAIRRHPEFLKELAGESLAVGRGVVELDALAATTIGWRLEDDAERGEEIRRFKRREELRVAARDLLGYADADAVGAELSALADAALRSALSALEPSLPFAVIALGRYGGGELSYASDLDVIFVYEGSGADSAGAAIETSKRLLREIGSLTPEGRAWEIDARLRPEGDSGQLARSVEGYTRYYAERARLWEFQSLLKARAVAGDPDLGARFCELIEPYVYRADFSPESAAEIRSMKRRIEAERLGTDKSGRLNLKLGPGGLADVEFCVQLLQLRFGASHPTVRGASTRAGLIGLTEAGLLDPDDAETLGAAYRWCESARNRLFLQSGRASDVLPTGEMEARSLALGLGYTDQPADEMHAAHTDVTTAARQVVDRVFYENDQPPAGGGV
jgi:glutamate-ammonia-ligase adenylyltransferase